MSNQNKPNKNIELEEIQEEAEVFLNQMNENIPNAVSALATFIKKDNTSDTWFFAESEEDLYVTGALIIKQIADYLNVNMFEVILQIQTQLAQVYEEDYGEYVKKINAFGEELREAEDK